VAEYFCGAFLMAKFSLAAIQKALSEFKLDGWLFYDYRGSDPIGRSILNFTSQHLRTRRWFYFIPDHGVPVKIVHSIEREVLDHLPGKKLVYMGWREMENELAQLFKTNQKIAVQYSPKSAIPYISRIDAGIFELIKSFKIKPVSSADLLQLFEARWTEGQLNTHKNAAKLLNGIIQKTFRYIRKKMTSHEEITEYMVQKYLMVEMKKKGLIFDHPPLVAAGKNSGIPHYFPTQKQCDPIFPGTIVQINVWGKEKTENAVYAVIAWVGYTADKIPDEIEARFNQICQARDLAIAHIDNSIKNKRAIHGWEVDDLVRDHLKKAGLDSYFLHRTGHSIGRQVNDTGTNIDNLETRDERQIIAKTCFSIEPALYFSDYGMRSEVNVFVDEKGAHVFTIPVQDKVQPILG
jgi:Xaa-Pro aminopeptidase